MKPSPELTTGEQYSSVHLGGGSLEVKFGGKFEIEGNRNYNKLRLLCMFFPCPLLISPAPSCCMAGDMRDEELQGVT